MINKNFRTFALIGAVAFYGLMNSATAEQKTFQFAGLQTPGGEHSGVMTPPLSKGIAGKYLSSHFAQSQYDWQAANHYINQILIDDPDNADLVRRSMILAIGIGDIDLAAKRAQELIQIDDDTGLALMIVAVRDMAEGNMDGVYENLDAMAQGDMTDFVKPILRGWASASKGKLDIEGFNDTTIHLYHAALLATYLDDKPAIKEFTSRLISAGTLSNGDAERTADLLAIQGEYQQAAALYEGVFAQDSTNKRLADKVAEIRKDKGGNILDLVEPLKITAVQQGAAMALYDMAYILYQEHSDSSTKLFANMALALDPALTDARLLLADTLTRNGRFDEAILELSNIPEGHPSYLAVQRHAAELLAEAGRKDAALEKLNKLFTDHNDIEALIRVGDLYRNQEDFTSALTAYNKAARQIGDKIPEDYWHLLYARGMAYERQGEWSKAEADLKDALVYRPNHPYLLNYLGYGWADQGLNLEQSLELIKRAVALRPTDGYIIDSMGWVQYMMGDYEAALPSLEQAVELLPYDTTINDHLGDVYWKVGRQMEARFQWERAANYSEDQAAKDRLAQKLRYGLDGVEEIKKANVE